MQFNWNRPGFVPAGFPVRWLFCWLLLGGATGCGPWDDDAAFVPRHATTVLLLETETGPQLLRYSSEGTLEFPWQPASWLTPVGDAAADEGNLWLTTPETRQVYRLNPQTGTISETMTAPIRTDRLWAGDTWVLVADTARAELCWLDIEADRKVYTVSLPAPALRGLYRAPICYVPLADLSLRVYHETAMTELKRVSFAHPIVDLTLDRLYNLHILTRDSSGQLYHALMDAHGHHLVETETPIDYTKRRYSPYWQPHYEMEFLGELTLTDQRIAYSVSVDSVRDFAVDFRRGGLYLLAGDSLHLLDLHTRVERQRWPLPRTVRGIQRAMFFYSPAS